MKTFKAALASLALIAAGPLTAQDFSHEIADGPVPWNDKPFDAGEDRFMFAIHGDLTGGERPDVFEIAMAQINLLRPEFVINVGDLIEGGEVDRAQYLKQWDEYDRRVDTLRAPIFYVGGNHDLTNMLSKEIWAERLGPSYYHFLYKDVLFLVLDAEDNTPDRIAEISAARAEAVEIYKTEGREAFAKTEYNQMPERSSGTIGAEQAAYFRDVIATHANVRWTFVIVHKTVWERADESAFASIEAALSGRNYTVFNGHEHYYAYRQRHGQDHIQLATTSGEQFPDLGLSEDHVTFVTVSGEEVDIANLMLAGIRDRTGHIPLEGDDVCFATAECGENE
ncbi:metallophosphoesterase [Tropicimonas sp. TH_r6]|uniref:metallophosphoesterase family protein n=1 Tax=Tropicimonas sp. TH_r6 TaxID=3082085 RepID=UPI00295342DF|nr:metallophosphoesterase [Tropicimonas sp. TH_r6]MDV7143847.1 metallophosphoesterase [Tropicimonas sp. TH_r6]